MGITATLIGLVTMNGCGGGDSLPREAVSGSVSVEGKPLAAGLITFLPDSPDVPTQGGAAIIDGKYEIPKAQGLVPGKYKIVISAPEDEEPAVDPNLPPGFPPPPRKEVIPSQYNAKSLLTAEVTAGRQNVFEYNLTSKVPSK